MQKAAKPCVRLGHHREKKRGHGRKNGKWVVNDKVDNGSALGPREGGSRHCLPGEA